MSGSGAVRGVILDLDGVVYRGDAVLPGAREIGGVRAAGIRVVALTNHSGRTVEAYGEKLAGLGVGIPPGDVITSGWATARYLRSERPGARVLVVGTEALHRELVAQGVAVVGAGDEADVVAVGFVSDLCEAPLHAAVGRLLAGAELIATNEDAVLPMPEGVVPEAGPVVAYLEAATGRRAYVVGKPNPRIVELALERLGVAREETLLVGDTLATDVAAARAAGIRAALVLTGNTPAPPADDAGLLVARDLAEVLTWIRSGRVSERDGLR